MRQAPTCSRARPDVDAATIDDDQLSRLDVRGQGAKRNRQIVETHVWRQGGPYRLARKRSSCWPATAPVGSTAVPLRTPNSAPPKRRRSSSLLRTERLRTIRIVGEHALPARVAQRLLDAIRADTGSPRAADDRAHAGTHDAVDRHAQLLQHAQHADVCRAARTAAAQYETGAWAIGWWAFVCRGGGGPAVSRQSPARRPCQRTGVKPRAAAESTDVSCRKTARTASPVEATWG
jgi:hypothetical protein